MNDIEETEKEGKKPNKKFPNAKGSDLTECFKEHGVCSF